MIDPDSKGVKFMLRASLLGTYFSPSLSLTSIIIYWKIQIEK